MPQKITICWIKFCASWKPWPLLKGKKGKRKPQRTKKKQNLKKKKEKTKEMLVGQADKIKLS
jgi:hypothetical protein